MLERRRRPRTETARADERQTTASTSVRLTSAPAPRESARSLVLCSVASLRRTFATRAGARRPRLAGATALRRRARATEPVERALARSKRNERAHERTNGTNRQTRTPSQYPPSEHGGRAHDLWDFSYRTGFLFIHWNHKRGREETSAAAVGGRRRLPFCVLGGSGRAPTTQRAGCGGTRGRRGGEGARAGGSRVRHGPPWARAAGRRPRGRPAEGDVALRGHGHDGRPTETTRTTTRQEEGERSVLHRC